MNAFVEDFWVLGVAMLAMLPLLLLMRRPKNGAEMVLH